MPLQITIKDRLVDEEVEFFSRNSRCLFHDYPWINLWHQVFQKSGRYAICDEGGTITAIFPFYFTRNADRRLPFVRWNELCLMATGSIICTDYADFPATQSTRSAWGEGLAQFLQNVPNWDVIRFSDVLMDSNAYTLFEAMRARGYETIVMDRSHCPYFDLDFENVDAFIRRKPSHFRKNLMRRVRNINNQCNIRYESDVTPEVLESLFDNLVRLHNIRKETKGISGIFGNPYFKKFHSGAFRWYASRGQLFVPRLLDGDKVIAIRYAFIDKGVYYGYQTGMDPAYSTFSPGEVLTYYIIEDLKKRGIRRFDFLRGAEKHKFNWSTNETVLKDLLVFRNSLRGLGIFGYIKGLKRLRESELVGRARKFLEHRRQSAVATHDKAGGTSDNG